MIDIARLGNVLIGEITEFKSKIKKLYFSNFGFAFRVKGCKNSPVFAEDVVDVSHEIIGVTVLFVVMAGPTLIRAKSFV